MRRLGLWLLLLLAAAGVAAADPPLRVTTDSSAYCESLASRLGALPAGETEPARSLGQEGKMLCASGHVRSGIAKLRRALRAAHAQR